MLGFPVNCRDSTLCWLCRHVSDIQEELDAFGLQTPNEENDCCEELIECGISPGQVNQEPEMQEQVMTSDGVMC